MSLQANELRQMSSELMNCQSHAWQTSSELMVPRGPRVHGLKGSMANELRAHGSRAHGSERQHGKQAHMANKLRAGELRAGELQGW